MAESETENHSETSMFLPSCNEFHDELGESESTSINNNLGILVISEEIPLNSEKSNGVRAAIGDNVTRKTEKEEIEGRKRSGWRNYIGIVLTLISSFVFSLGGIIVKYMKEYHPFTLAVYRFQGILLPSLFMVLYVYYVQKVKVFKPVWPLTNPDKRKRVLGMILRSVFGTTALFLHFYALQKLDVADASVIGACQPVFVTFAAYLFLGEACGVFSVFTAILTIVGVGIISRPPILTGEESFDEEKLLGAGFSLASMFTATMVFVILRYLKDVHFSLLTFVLGCWGTLQSVLCAVVIGEFTLPQTGEHWLLAGALAGITLIAQVGLTLALQYEQAGVVALVRTCDCLFAFVLQFILLSTVPDFYSLTGASIIIFCVVLTAIRKWISTLPNSHPARNWFWFVLE